jgi:hypothetical protein
MVPPRGKAFRRRSAAKPLQQFWSDRFSVFLELIANGRIAIAHGAHVVILYANASGGQR